MQEVGSTRVESPKSITIAEAIEDIGIGPAQLLFTLAVCGVWAMDGIDLTMVGAVASPVADEWHLSDMQRASLVVAAYGGQILGALVLGAFSDRIGRRPVVLGCFFGICAVGFMSTYLGIAWLFFLARFAVGVFLGAGLPSSLALAIEAVPLDWRADVNGLAHLSYRVGHLFSAALVYLDDPAMQHLNWRWLLRMCALPAMVFWLVCFRYLQESAAFLAQAGQRRKAQEVLAIMQSDNNIPVTRLTIACAPSQDASDFVTEWVSLWSLRPLVKTNFVLIYSFFVQNFTWFAALYAFTTIMPEVPGETSSAFALMLSAVAGCAGVAIATIICRAWERKLILKLAFVLQIFAAIAMITGPTGSLQFYHGYYGLQLTQGAAWVVMWLYANEVYPTSVRATSVGMVCSLGRVGGLVSPFVTEAVTSLGSSVQAIWYVLAGVSFVNFLAIYALPFETYNKPLIGSVKSMDSVNLESNSDVEYGEAERILRSTVTTNYGVADGRGSVTRAESVDSSVTRDDDSSSLFEGTSGREA